MEGKTKTRTEQILPVMKILVWIAYVGFIVKAGAILISYGVSCVNPEGAKDLYKGLNLYSLRQFSFWHYTLSVFLIIALLSMKALISGLIIKTLSKVNLTNPFTSEVAVTIERISYALFGTWIIAMLNNAHTRWLIERIDTVEGDWLSGEFMFVAGLVFILSQIFKRGVEIQSENDLTV